MCTWTRELGYGTGGSPAMIMFFEDPSSISQKTLDVVAITTDVFEMRLMCAGPDSNWPTAEVAPNTGILINLSPRNLLKNTKRKRTRKPARSSHTASNKDCLLWCVINNNSGGVRLRNLEQLNHQIAPYSFSIDWFFKESTPSILD